MKINIRKTIENAVVENGEFHFYIDELSVDDSMPTYMGLADEKYTFDEMNDEFFEFISNKVNQDGVYIRLIHILNSEFGFNNPADIIECDADGDVGVVAIETGSFKKDLRTNNSNIPDFDVVDYGIKVRGDEITFGSTVFNNAPYFEEFGLNESYLSYENPVNEMLIEMMKDLIFFD